MDKKSEQAVVILIFRSFLFNIILMIQNKINKRKKEKKEREREGNNRPFRIINHQKH